MKSLICIDVLFNAPADPAARADVEKMLATSDDTIASRLWSRRGAGAIVTRTRDLIGLPSLTPPDSAGEWGSTRIDAVDVARIWRYVIDVAPDDVRRPVLAGTGAANEIAADGVDRYFGTPCPGCSRRTP